jgi:hypothetical protein
MISVPGTTARENEVSVYHVGRGFAEIKFSSADGLAL